jgi:hypothetical protein
MFHCVFNGWLIKTQRPVPAFLIWLLAFSAFAPSPLKGSFIGDYALENFTFTQTSLNPTDPTPPNGTAEISPEGWLVLTGSNTGSLLFPGANTDLTIAAAGTGQVSFDWVYSTLDDPDWDIASYLLGGVNTPLAFQNGESGSISFPVMLGETFGFRVWTKDNGNEPGILTIKNFAAPSQSAVPEPGTSALLLLALAGGATARRFLRRTSSAAEERR